METEHFLGRSLEVRKQSIVLRIRVELPVGYAVRESPLGPVLTVHGEIGVAVAVIRIHGERIRLVAGVVVLRGDNRGRRRKRPARHVGKRIGVDDCAGRIRQMRNWREAPHVRVHRSPRSEETEFDPVF